GITGAGVAAFCRRIQRRSAATMARARITPAVHITHAHGFGISTGGLIARMSFVLAIEFDGAGGGMMSAEFEAMTTRAIGGAPAFRKIARAPRRRIHPSAGGWNRFARSATFGRATSASRRAARRTPFDDSRSQCSLPRLRRSPRLAKAIDPAPAVRSR